MTYNPDGDPNDFDKTDFDSLMAWFDHPNTRALHDDLGRQFRAMAASHQIDALEIELGKAISRRDQLSALLENASEDDPRWALQSACADLVERITIRLSELRQSSTD